MNAPKLSIVKILNVGISPCLFVLGILLILLAYKNYLDLAEAAKPKTSIYSPQDDSTQYYVIIKGNKKVPCKAFKITGDTLYAYQRHDTIKLVQPCQVQIYEKTFKRRKG